MIEALPQETRQLQQQRIQNNENPAHTMRRSGRVMRGSNHWFVIP
jgi:hypothetical protein